MIQGWKTNKQLEESARNAMGIALKTLLVFATKTLLGYSVHWNKNGYKQN